MENIKNISSVFIGPMSDVMYTKRTSTAPWWPKNQPGAQIAICGNLDRSHVIFMYMMSYENMIIIEKTSGGGNAPALRQPSPPLLVRP